MTTKRKVSGDVEPIPREIERAIYKARVQGKTPAAVCVADHSGIRGRRCGYCGTYFRGDDNG